ncbi:MAG: hypothetical protein WC728_13975 [Elusimicrobiota bacterium]
MSDLDPGKSDVDIPILKKKKEERKGAGAVLQGADVGQGVVAVGGATARAGGGLAALFTGKIAAVAVALGLGGAALVGYGVMQQGKVQRAGPKGPALEAPDMGVRVSRRDSQGSKSLAYLARVGEGQIKWDEPTAGKTAADAPNAEGGAAGAEKTADAASESKEGMPEAPDQFTRAGRMENTLSGAKLSSQLGGGFGKNNIFSGKGTFNLKPSADLGKNLSRTMAAAGGKTLTMSRQKSGALMAKKLDTRGVSANKAMGQLKFSGRRSAAAAAAGSGEAGATYAGEAFEQTKVDGAPGTTGAIGDGSVDPMGGSAPDMTSGSGVSEGGPDVGPGENATPYQPYVDNAQQLTSTAKTLLIAGFALIAIGAAMMLAGVTGVAAVVAAILIGIGVGLCMAAMMMHQQARQMGDTVGNDYGQKDQQHIIDRTATNSGNRAYTSPDNDFQMKDNTVHEDTEKEKNADYQLQ